MSDAASARPPSVEAILKGLRVACPDADPAALAVVARRVVEDERVAAVRRRVEACGRRSRRRRAGTARGIRGPGAVAGHQRDGRHRPHEPRSGPLGGERRGRRGRARHAARSCSSWTAATGRRGARARVAEDHLVALTGAEDAFVTNNNAAALALAVGPGRTRRGRRLARGAHRDRRRRPDPRDHPAGRGQAHRGGHHEPDAGGGLRGAARRGSRPGDPARPPVELRDGGFTETPDRGRGRGARPPPRRDRHRRPGIRARSSTRRAFGLSPRADARRAARGRFGRGHVQRRQAGRWAAGRAGRRAGRPHRADAQGPAGARDATRQDDDGRGRPDARAVSVRARGRRDPRLAADRADGGRAPGASRGAREAHRAARPASSRCARPSAAARCPARRSPSWGVALDGALGGPAARRAPAAATPIVIGRIADGRVVLDLRTVEPARDGDLAAAIERALAGRS